jgi:hypothetical protein
VANTRRKRKKNKAAIGPQVRQDLSPIATASATSAPATPSVQVASSEHASAQRHFDRFGWFRWLKNHPKVSGGGGIGVAFAIVLKGIDWQIDGAVKSAAFAFLLAWAVLAFAIYVSNVWDRRRSVASIVWVLAGVLLGTIWWAYLPSPPIRPETPPSAIEQLNRIEFRTESRQRVYKAGLVIRLNRAMTADEIGAFGVAFRLVKPFASNFMASCRDFRLHAQPHGGSTFGTRIDLWEGGVNTRDTRSEFPKSVSEIECVTDYPADKFTARTVDSFNGDLVDAVMTARLAPFVSEIDLVINDFVLISVTNISLQEVISPDTFYNSDNLASEEKVLVWQKVKVGEPNGPFGFRDQAVLDFDAKPPRKRTARLSR